MTSSFLAFLVISSLLNCAAKQPPAPQVPDLVVQATQTTDHLAAVKMLEDFLATNPAPEQAAWAKLQAGEERRLLGDLQSARRWFEQVANDHPTHPAKEMAVLGIALVDSHQSLSGNTLATLQLVPDDGVPDTMNADRYRLLARVAADDGTPPSKVRPLVDKAVKYAAGDEGVEARVSATLYDLLAEDQASGLASSPEAQAGAEEVAMARARAALHSDNYAEAIKLADAVLSTWPDTIHKREAEYLKRRAQAGDPAVARKVAVLLPLSGEYAVPGERLRQTVMLANDRSAHPMDLIFVDTAGDPDRAVAELERLLLTEGVIACLGPLLKETAGPVAEAAQAMGLPTVTLSQSLDPEDVGDFVFRGFMPLEQQISALLDHAMDRRGLRQFAILYPNNPYGQAAAELFKAGVEARGGQINVSREYDAEATSFLDDAQALGNKDYKSRANELWRLKKEAEREGKDPKKVVLPPLYDFEAIFIPDSAQRVPLVASALAYEEFPVGGFKPHRHDNPMPLMGLNAWNNPKIVKAGGLPLQDSIFVDAFLPTSPDTSVEAFVNDYESSLGREPLVIDALAWDATRLLAKAANSGDADRDAVRAELATTEIVGPVGGGTRFGADRDVQRKLLVLTIGDGGIQEWVPPELAMPPEGLEISPEN